jgi:hypothetical protein
MGTHPAVRLPGRRVVDATPEHGRPGAAGSALQAASLLGNRRVGQVIADDAVAALAVLQRQDPKRFLLVLLHREPDVYRVLSPWGFRGCWENPADYLPDAEAAIGRWMAAGGWQVVHPILAMLPDPRDDEVILAARPDGSGYVTTRRQHRANLGAWAIQREMQTLRNITGGVFGALGYWLGGHRGSDLGALGDAVGGAFGGTLAGRQQVRDVGRAGPSRPVAQEQRTFGPPTPSRPAARQPAARTEVDPIPVAPRPAPVSPSPAAASPAAPSLASPARTPAPAAPTAATPAGPQASGLAWRREWDETSARADRPTPRRSDNGFRTETRMLVDGHTKVVVVEGVVRPPIGGASTSRYGSRLEGEDSTHPTGRQLGEDTGPGAQGAAPAGLNRGPLLQAENWIRRAADRAAEQGATVETRSTMVTQRRTVGGEEVDVLVGIRKEAWLRIPGADRTVPLMRFEAVIDPVTRAYRVLTPAPGSR